MTNIDVTRTDAGLVLKELVQVNQRLLSLAAADVEAIGAAIDHRGRLMTQLGRLLRDHAYSGVNEHFRAALSQALEDGDAAVLRLLALERPFSPQPIVGIPGHAPSSTPEHI